MQWPNFAVENLFEYIRNVKGDLNIHQTADDNFTIFNPCGEQHWNTSIYFYYITFTMDIINKSHLSFLKKKSFTVIAMITSVFLKLAQAEDIIFYNHNFMTTNLWGEEKHLSANIQYIINHYPNQSIVFRSINKIHYSLLLKQLTHLKTDLVFFRFIIGLDHQGKFSKKIIKTWKKDAKALSSQGYEIIYPAFIKDHEASRLYTLYKMLYLEKYNTGNWFTEKFFSEIIRDPSFKIVYLKKENIDAFRLFEIKNGIIQAPCIGYDLQKNHQHKLYQQLSAIWPEILDKHQALLNWSSGHKGVWEFKLNRGGVETQEYYGLYVNHLCWLRRFGWMIAIKIINFWYPMIHQQFLISGRNINEV